MVFNLIQDLFSHGKSLLRVSPLFVKRLLKGHISESREAYFDSVPEDNVYAFFGEPVHIIDNIYLGSSYHAANWDWLTSNNVKTIVNAALEVDNFFSDDLEYISGYSIRDNGLESFTNIDTLVDQIREKNCVEGNTFVHCLVGRSRSVTIIIAYLMKYHKMTVEDSINHIVSKRSYANPSLKLVDNLKDYQKYLDKINDRVLRNEESNEELNEESN